MTDLETWFLQETRFLTHLLPERIKGLGMETAGFFQKVYELVQQVPEGHVATYGQIAAALGNPRQARQVGWAMRVCPDAVPWHRVVNAQGRLSTHSECGSLNMQRALLEDEGVRFEPDGRIDLSLYGWSELKNR